MKKTKAKLPLKGSVDWKAARKKAYADARAEYLDINNESPNLGAIAAKYDVHLPRMLEYCANENWDMLRANAKTQLALGNSNVRLQVVQNIDKALLEAAASIVSSAGSAYVSLMQEISRMPIDFDIPIEMNVDKNDPKAVADAKAQLLIEARKQKLKPLLMIKVDTLNAAAEGWAKFAVAMRDMGLVLTPPETKADTPPAATTLIQINGAPASVGMKQAVATVPPPPPL